ncbi:MAG: polysaccharide biosynthesis/export family protein [Pseudomonadota bacterium]
MPRRFFCWFVFIAALAITGCASRETPAQFTPQAFQPWSAAQPLYRLYPGDVIEITVHTAPELSGPATVGPDGRVSLQMAGSVQVAERTAETASAAIRSAYGRVLRDPLIDIRPLSFGSQRILVGGEVQNPGLLEMPTARIGALEAVLLAGGFNTTADRSDVVILRRAPDGGVMMRVVDLRSVLNGSAQDPIPLLRHDIVFVPRSGIAEVNLFVEQYVRNILPVDQAFAFALADSVINND